MPMSRTLGEQVITGFVPKRHNTYSGYSPSALFVISKGIQR
jgi:hypothetical protein